MFGISIGEITLICVVALIVFGPEKLPEIARSIGRISGELRRNTDRMRREFYNSVYVPAADFGKSIETASRNLVSSADRQECEAKPPAEQKNPENTEKGAS